MVKATVTWANGDCVICYYPDFDQMFQDIRRFYGYRKMEAHEVRLKDMRQGRCN